MHVPPLTLARALLSLPLVAAMAHPAAAALPGGSIDATVQLPTGDEAFRAADAESIRRFFNEAHCECSDAVEAPTPGTDPTHFAIKYELNGVDAGSLTGWSAELWVGSGCDDRQIRVDTTDCAFIETIPDLSVLRSATDNVRAIPLQSFMFPNQSACAQTTETNSVYLLIDEDNDSSEFETVIETQINFDTEPPPLPLNLDIVPAENAAKLSWDTPTARVEDIYYYQVLCATIDGAPVFDVPPVEPRYQTAEGLCPDAVSGAAFAPAYDPAPGYFDMHDAGLADAGTADANPAAPDAGSTTIPLAFQGLSADYLCAETSGSSNSLRVGGLQNGQEYQFMLLVVDQSENVTYYDMGTETPAAVIDFWENYQNQGGGAEGGVCLATSTYGDDSGFTRTLRDFRDRSLASSALGRKLIDAYYAHIAPLGVYADRDPIVRALFAIALAPVVAIAALWVYAGPGVTLGLLLALVWLRRRRRARGHALHDEDSPRPAQPWAVAAAAALVVLAWAGPAAAQRGYDPYFQEFKPVEASAPLLRSQWNFGFKLGPYVPAVDSEFDLAEGQAGPYESMFGGSGLMGQIELDRFFLWPAGQLGASASLGWMSKSASAYATEICQDPTAPDCINGVRIAVDDNGNPILSEGDTTTFHLMPMSLGVVYRFTTLDERLSIPVVPYGKAGLSYYLWWVTQPSGALAEAPTAMCPDPGSADCEGERARGASLGWQVSLGLALRAERIDKQSAMSLRNEYGIEHAGFYAEMAYAKVDGFGSDTRLRVGDLTWFAGLNFEF